MKYDLLYVLYGSWVLSVFYFTMVELKNRMRVFEEGLMMSNDDRYDLVRFYLFCDDLKKVLRRSRMKSWCGLMW